MNLAEPHHGLNRRCRKIVARLGAASHRLWLAWLAVGVIATAAHGQGQAGVSVSGDHLIRNGRDWVPKGFTWVGYVAPVSALTSGWYQHAHSMDEGYLLRQARSLGADTIRIQVSQPGLDPSSSIYDPGYADQVTAVVRRARQSGFVVIVSMQWERPSGLANQPHMPSASTQRAWLPLLHALGSDRGVMLELLNEPGMWSTNPAGWPTWHRDMQAIVNEARANGARNVLILDGLRGAQVLAGAPSIQDPHDQLAYAVHPYMSDKVSTASDWERNWGDFAESHAVIVTEWNEIPAFKLCGPIVAYSRQLVSYLAEKQIGLVLWAQDIPSTIFDHSGQPRSLAHFACGSSNWGAAAAALRYFRAE